jgi:hypothetical protein
MNEAGIFEWKTHDSHATYKSAELAFKIKKEKVASTVGYEVFIADDKQRQDWRSLRLFTDVREMGDVMRWVESIAPRLLERKR